MVYWIGGNVFLLIKVTKQRQCAAGDFVESEGASWQATLDINLRAALVGTRLAAQAMIGQRTKGNLQLNCKNSLKNYSLQAKSTLHSMFTP